MENMQAITAPLIRLGTPPGMTGVENSFHENNTRMNALSVCVPERKEEEETGKKKKKKGFARDKNHSPQLD
jgi:hypothetical protein